MSLKILHRIYFGFDGKPDPYKEYLKTWEEQLPDYKIMHWNADNLPMDINEYTQKMYELKDHAFLSDFFRWWVVREHGGIYLDADIEVVDGQKFNAIVEELEQSEEYDAFFGVEMYFSGYTAHSMASKKQSELSKFMCRVYEGLGTSSLYLWRKQEFSAPKLMHLYLHSKGVSTESQGFLCVLQPTIIAGVKIYPKEYFAPLSYGKEFWLESHSDEHTCLCHHYSISWIEDSGDSMYTNQRDNFNKRLVMYKDYLSHKPGKLLSLRKYFYQNDMRLEWVSLKENEVVNFLQYIIKLPKHIIKFVVDGLKLIQYAIKLITKKEEHKK